MLGTTLGLTVPIRVTLASEEGAMSFIGSLGALWGHDSCCPGGLPCAGDCDLYALLHRAPATFADYELGSATPVPRPSLAFCPVQRW